MIFLYYLGCIAIGLIAGEIYTRDAMTAVLFTIWLWCAWSLLYAMKWDEA